MGGNAIKNFGTSCRISNKEFESLSLEMVALVSNEKKQAYVIPSYRNKQDHGDMDLIVGSSFWEAQSRKDIEKKLGAIGHVRNGEATSYAVPIDTRLFQVDIISVPDGSLDFAYNYFSYNDLGNLIGRVAHRAGFKLGHHGMSFILRDPSNSDHVFGEVVLTKDWASALEFFGYDPDRYFNGFDDLEDIFKFAMSTPIATKEIYLLENLNNTSRTRDRKRKTYKKFLEWLERNNTSGCIQTSPEEKQALRAKWLQKAFVAFPEFKEKYDEQHERFQKVKKVNSMVNGNVVNEITGLTDVALGEFMRAFRNAYSVEELCEMEKHQILDLLISFKQEYSAQEICGCGCGKPVKTENDYPTKELY